MVPFELFSNRWNVQGKNDGQSVLWGSAATYMLDKFL
jgi:hypothetical protein